MLNCPHSINGAKFRPNKKINSNFCILAFNTYFVISVLKYVLTNYNQIKWMDDWSKLYFVYTVNLFCWQ
jgi:hypothetical protein